MWRDFSPLFFKHYFNSATLEVSWAWAESMAPSIEKTSSPQSSEVVTVWCSFLKMLLVLFHFLNEIYLPKILYILCSSQNLLEDHEENWDEPLCSCWSVVVYKFIPLDAIFDHSFLIVERQMSPALCYMLFWVLLWFPGWIVDSTRSELFHVFSPLCGQWLTLFPKTSKMIYNLPQTDIFQWPC